MSASTQNSYMRTSNGNAPVWSASSNTQAWAPINMNTQGSSNTGQQRTQAWSAPVSSTPAWSASVSNTQPWSAPTNTSTIASSTQPWSGPTTTTSTPAWSGPTTTTSTPAWSAPTNTATTTSTPAWSGPTTTTSTQAWSAPTNTATTASTPAWSTPVSNTQAWSGPTSSTTNVLWTPQTNPGYGMPQSGMLPLVQPNAQWPSTPNNAWSGSSTSQRFVLEDSTPTQSLVSKNATVGQLLSGPSTSKAILFDSKVVLKQICGMGNTKGNLDFFSGMCTRDAPDDDDDASLSEDSDSDDEEDDYTPSTTSVQQTNVQSIPILKSEDDILPQESGETTEEYAERKRYYDLILKTKYSGHAYIYSRTLALRGRPGTHYSADVLNTLTIIERAIENLSVPVITHEDCLEKVAISNRIDTFAQKVSIPDVPIQKVPELVETPIHKVSTPVQKPDSTSDEM